jgi:hypothetical protein
MSDDADADADADADDDGAGRCWALPHRNATSDHQI